MYSNTNWGAVKFIGTGQAVEENRYSGSRGFALSSPLLVKVIIHEKKEEDEASPKEHEEKIPLKMSDVYSGIEILLVIRRNLKIHRYQVE
ncbi:unnamed protein product [Litomosoides sigmodontis]|uniref:Uncharacterized protein n=1 Tax=Litomosoides sigmodontis TaxID=42156 RepID=A0A3P6USX5_LITSI|nr:unnamed protein product [Litomosoides sigmodontis]